jgi:hypothetical protein
MSGLHHVVIGILARIPANAKNERMCFDSALARCYHTGHTNTPVTKNATPLLKTLFFCALVVAARGSSPPCGLSPILAICDDPVKAPSATAQ